jgi:hypothetical protein
LLAKTLDVGRKIRILEFLVGCLESLECGHEVLDAFKSVVEDDIVFEVNLGRHEVPFRRVLVDVRFEDGSLLPMRSN